MFTAEQRTKEFGIRKVLGATVISLFTLMSGEFVLMVVIALLIATPVAWWAMNNWVSNFAYRVSMEWWLFIIAGAIAVFIALITISFQAIKVALAKPVNSLRSE
jgi:ABC-type antimicrobial peptide transport system permease subunit